MAPDNIQIGLLPSERAARDEKRAQKLEKAADKINSTKTAEAVASSPCELLTNLSTLCEAFVPDQADTPGPRRRMLEVQAQFRKMGGLGSICDLLITVQRLLECFKDETPQAKNHEPARWRVQEDFITFNWSDVGEPFDPTNERHIALAAEHALTLEDAAASANGSDVNDSDLELATSWLVDHMGVSPEAAARYLS